MNTEMTRRGLAASTGAAALGVTGAACGLGGGRSEVKPSSGKQVSLVWLASRTGAEVAVWEGMARAAEQRYPNYKVEFANSPDSWTIKLPALMAANTGPDIVRLEG